MGKVTIQTDQGAKTINFNGAPPTSQDIDEISTKNGWKPVAAATAAPAPQQPKQGIFGKIDQAINKPAFDMSQNKSGPVGTLFKGLGNFAKDLGANIAGVAETPIKAVKNIVYDIPKTIFGKQDMGAYATPGTKNPQAGNYPLAAKSAAVAGLKDFPDTVLGSAAKTILPPSVQLLAGVNNGFKPEPAKALQSLAEKPVSNILPLVMGESALKGELTTGSKPIDSAVEAVGEAPKQLFNKTVTGPVKAVTEKVSSSYEGTGLPEKSLEEKVAKADKSIEEGISKGVKPTVVGKKTLEGSARFYDSAKSAVKSIAENRDKLQIVDANGEVVNKPSSNAEFAQAIDQTKKNIYKQYNDMTRAATGKDAAVPMASTISQLKSITEDLKYTPVVRKYAASKIPEIAELDGQSPQVIESRIAEYNKSLQNYYKNPTAESQVRAQVDASMAAELRRMLDSTIENTEGDGYQELKNKYGDLSAIEGEVNKRATVLARQNLKGLPDLTDIFTGGKLIGGILTGNVAAVAEGGFGMALKTLYKKLNSPDRAISSMFDDVYDAYPQQQPKLPFSQLSLPAGDTGGVFGKSSVNVPIPLPSKIRPLETGQDAPRTVFKTIKPTYTESGGKLTQIFGEPTDEAIEPNDISDIFKKYDNAEDIANAVSDLVFKNTKKIKPKNVK